jgi:hypothetical protein
MAYAGSDFIWEKLRRLCALKSKLQWIKACESVYIKFLEATSNSNFTPFQSHESVYKT